MAFSFETHVLPILLDMSVDPLDDNYRIKRRIVELDIETDSGRIDRLLRYMIESGYITATTGVNGSGAYYVFEDVRLTPRALSQLDLWPSDNERVLYLLRQLTDAFEQVAEEYESRDGDTAKAGRLRSAAQTLKAVTREAGTEITAKVISNLLAPG